MARNCILAGGVATTILAAVLLGRLQPSTDTNPAAIVSSDGSDELGGAPSYPPPLTPHERHVRSVAERKAANRERRGKGKAEGRRRQNDHASERVPPPSPAAPPSPPPAPPPEPPEADDDNGTADDLGPELGTTGGLVDEGDIFTCGGCAVRCKIYGEGSRGCCSGGCAQACRLTLARFNCSARATGAGSQDGKGPSPAPTPVPVEHPKALALERRLWACKVCEGVCMVPGVRARSCPTNCGHARK